MKTSFPFRYHNATTKEEGSETERHYQLLQLDSRIDKNLTMLTVQIDYRFYTGMRTLLTADRYGNDQVIPYSPDKPLPRFSEADAGPFAYFEGRCIQPM